MIVREALESVTQAKRRSVRLSHLRVRSTPLLCYLPNRPMTLNQKLFRTMQTADDGKPHVGTGDCMLGARVGIDIQPDKNGNVNSGHGMSVTPGDARRLPPHLRPERLGGFGALPVFWLMSGALDSQLMYEPDRRKPQKHGTVQPRTEMSLAKYQGLLASTRGNWNLLEEDI